MNSPTPGRALVAILAFASFLLALSPEGRARSCSQRPLQSFAVILHVEIVQKLAKTRMRTRLVQALRGLEARERLIIDYENVMVWTDRDPFRSNSEWIFAFGKRSEEYALILCATEYLPLENGKAAVDIDGSGIEKMTVEQIADVLGD